MAGSENARIAGPSRGIHVEEMTAALNELVKGQRQVTGDIAGFLKLQWARKRGRPVANLLFVGSDFTGKTKLAEALAEYLYRDYWALLQFDCREPDAESAAPRRYCGAEPGVLTRPVIDNPKRLIVFDEIEKAPARVRDLLVRLMGEGRLTDESSGEVADFAQSVVILTTSMEAGAIGKLQTEIGDPDAFTDAARSHLIAAGGLRPEIAEPIDRIYVFRELDDFTIAEIVARKMSELAKYYDLELVHVDAPLILRAIQAIHESPVGILALDDAVNGMVGAHIVAARKAGGRRVHLEIEEDGEIAISIEAQPGEIDAEKMAAALNRRVKGQARVTADVARLIRRQWAGEKRSRPIATLLFAGYHGTGKTELAKAIVEYLYSDEKALLRVDSGDMIHWESFARLVGVPVNFLGAPRGGFLTQALIDNPRRLILFEGIERAHPAVLDILSQLIGEGRLTDRNSGEVADFTQSIVILETNLEARALDKLREEIGDPDELNRAARSQLAASGLFRPEIAEYLDGVFPFKRLDGLAMAEIAVQTMKQMAREYGIELLYIDVQVILKALSADRQEAGRDVRMLQREIDEMLGEYFLAARDAGARRVRLDLEEDGVMAIGQVD